MGCISFSSCDETVVWHILADMENDPWLEKWIPLIQQKSAHGLVLELGCGHGLDTAVLLVAGCKVIASDLSTENLSECADIVPQAHLLQMDNGKPFPFVDHSFSVIVASLSLHYFMDGHDADRVRTQALSGNRRRPPCPLQLYERCQLRRINYSAAD